MILGALVWNVTSKLPLGVVTVTTLLFTLPNVALAPTPDILVLNGNVVVLSLTVCPLLKLIEPPKELFKPIKLPEPEVEIVVGISTPARVPRVTVT